MRSHAVGLTVACLHFEAVVVFSLGALVALVSPGAGEVEFDAALWWRDGAAAWTLADSVAYMSAIALIEPFYIAGGFSLYLNRRAVLEGWDVEVALRRMATRLAGARPAAAFAAVALGGALALGGGEALAQPAAGKSARGEIVEVLKAPEFQEHREVMRWRYRGGAERPDDPTRERGAAGFLDGLARFLAVLAEFGLWLAVAALVVAALLAARRFVPSLAEARAERYRPPETLFGLALAPQSLPPDLAAAACDLIAGGRMREALSLLYRGALSTLAHRDGVRLAAGDTEGDCTRAARRMLPEGAARYFERLVGTWQGAAYAARLPEPGVALELALEWPAHFGAGNGAAQERA
ncbi:MAG: hypothetical protein M5U08_25860 [Burkholderiales bacterium]|nr:hypothetical protein [Burkholderiales bacterium]